LTLPQPPKYLISIRRTVISTELWTWTRPEDYTENFLPFYPHEATYEFPKCTLPHSNFYAVANLK